MPPASDSVVAPLAAPIRRLVCVHGAGGGGWEWDIWRRVCAARGVHVTAPDLLPNADGVAATRFADYRAQVRAWCAEQPAPYALVGASLGGLLALVAEAAPSALILINPLPPLGIEPRPPRRSYPARVRWGSARRLGSTLAAMPDADAAARLHAWRRWRDESGAVLDDAATVACDAAPRCPVLVIASAHYDVVAPATSRALAASLGADFMLWRDASHVGPLLGRSAAACAGAALDWLARLAAPQV